MTHQERIEDILCEWEEKRRRGVAASAESLCVNQPDLLDTVKVQIDALEKMYGVLNPRSVEPEVFDPLRMWPSPPGYEYLDYLGAGGMGVVFKAVDQVLARVVAIKVVRDSRFAHPHVIERFRQEAEAVARLRHPNIVQVYSLAHHEGRPFFSLEYVNGGSLADRLNEGTIPARQGAWLVEQLANAAHAAHLQGIVHRDLKPANILLHLPDQAADVKTNELAGRSIQWESCIPKITDFGVAKMVGEEDSFTKTGEILGSPSYMAPEQARGQQKKINAATDVYALGAILYQMLVGRPPFLGASQIETLDLVRTMEPVRPRTLDANIPSDLENICLKCLDKEPGRRYETAAQLADDLGRFRNGETVVARPVSPTHRAWRWCQRNPVLTVLTCLLVLSMFAGSTGVIWNWQQAKQSQKIAEQNLATARQTIDQYLIDVSEEILLEEPGFEELRSRLLTSAQAFYQQLIADYEDRDDLQVELADAYVRLAKIKSSLGQYREAEQHLRAVIQIATSQATEDAKSSDRIRLLVDSHTALGKLQFNQGRFADATDSVEKALEHARRVNDLGENSTLQEGLADVYQVRGSMFADEQRNADALNDFESATGYFQKLRSAFPENRRYPFRIAEVEHLTGSTYFKIGKTELAKKHLNRAADILSKLMVEHANILSYREALARVLGSMGSIELKTGSADVALDIWSRALDIQMALVVTQPQVLRHKDAQAMHWHNIGLAHLDLRQLDESRKAIQEAIDIRSKMAVSNPSVQSNRESLARCFTSLGNVEQKAGNATDALAAYSSAEKFWAELNGEHPERPEYLRGWAQVIYNRAMSEFDAGDLATALECSSRADEMAQKLRNEFPEVSDYQRFLVLTGIRSGRFLLENGEHQQAEHRFQNVISQSSSLVDGHEPRPEFRSGLVSALYQLSRMQIRLGDTEQAGSVMNQALGLAKSLVDEFPQKSRFQAQLINCKVQQSVIHKNRGEFEESELLLTSAIEEAKRLVVESNDTLEYLDSLSAAYINLGVLSVRQNRPKLAVNSYRQAIELADRMIELAPEQRSWKIKKALAQANLGGFYTEVAKYEEAIGILNANNVLMGELLNDFPDSDEVLNGAATSIGNLGNAYSKLKRYDAAVEAYDQSLGHLHHLLNVRPNHSQAQKFLSIIHWGKAVALMRSNEFGAAARHWELADQTSPNSHNRLIFLTQQGECWINAGLEFRAFEISREIANLDSDAGENYWWAARTTALAIRRAIRQEGELAHPDVVDEGFTNIFQWLRDAYQMGHLKDPKLIWQLEKSPAFSELQKLDEFEELMIEFKN